MTTIDNNIDFLNTFIDKIKKSQDTIFCDSTCQYNKKEEQLKKNYDLAIMNYKQGPNIIKNRFKDYYVFKNGEASYQEEIEKKYNNEANIMINTFKESIQEIISKIIKSLEIYNANMKYLTDIYPAFYLYHENNTKLQKEIAENNSISITNNRKFYYENEEINNSSKTKQIITILYFFITVICLSYIFFTSNKSIPVKIILSLVFLLYPLYIFYFYNLIMYLFSTLYSLLPTNIYLYK